MTNYKPYVYGQITKLEAGTLYRNVKQGNVTALRETTSMLYDLTKEYLPLSTERYNQDSPTYDAIYTFTNLLLANNFEDAQKEIELFEARMIRLAGKKSRYAKYVA